MMETLQAMPEEDLFRTLQAILQMKTGLLQEIVEWAAPDMVYSSARVLESRYVGTIKSYAEATGYGFISSPDIMEAFGKDLFLSHEQLSGRGHPLGTFPVGSQISFAILLNKGKPQAYDLCPIVNQSPPVAPPPPLPPTRTPDRQHWQSQGREDHRRFDGRGGSPRGDRRPRRDEAAIDVPPPPRAPSDERRYSAPVKSYVPDKGYGFLECPELAHIFGKPDIFVHAVELGDLAPLRIGQMLSFAVRPDSKGKPMATDIYVEGGDRGEQWPSRDRGASDNSWAGGGPRRSGAAGAPPRTTGCGKGGGGGRRYSGPVKSFVSSKGYGFVLCDEIVAEFGKPDVFLHAREMGDLAEDDLKPGTMVSFEVVSDRNGKAMAVKVGLDDGRGGSWKRPRQEW